MSLFCPMTFLVHDFVKFFYMWRNPFTIPPSLKQHIINHLLSGSARLILTAEAFSIQIQVQPASKIPYSAIWFLPFSYIVYFCAAFFMVADMQFPDGPRQFPPLVDYPRWTIRMKADCSHLSACYYTQPHAPLPTFTHSFTENSSNKYNLLTHVFFVCWKVKYFHLVLTVCLTSGIRSGIYLNLKDILVCNMSYTYMPVYNI